MKREDLYVRGLPQYDGTYDFIKQLGGDPHNLARKANLKNVPAKETVHFMPWESLCRFFELAAQDLNEPNFGLKWAWHAPENARNTGPTLFLASIASSRRHFLNMIVTYISVHMNGLSFKYEEDVGAGMVTGVFDIHPLSPPCRQFCEHVVALFTVMARRTVPDFKLNAVTFQYSAPDDMSWYEKMFQCPVHFNADRNTILVDHAFLGTKKTPNSLKVITHHLQAYLNWRVKKHPYGEITMSQLVTEVLPSILGVYNVDIVTVADALNIHPKKLQRLLADEGTSYSDILGAVRRNIAERLLSETNISIQRVAKMLDYSTDRAFTKAAKRWFGVTPSEYRKQMK